MPFTASTSTRRIVTSRIFSLQLLYGGRDFENKLDRRTEIRRDLELLTHEDSISLGSITVKPVQDPQRNTELVELRFLADEGSTESVIGQLYARIASKYLQDPKHRDYRKLNIYFIIFQDIEDCHDGRGERVIHTIGPRLRVQLQLVYNNAFAFDRLTAAEVKETVIEHIRRLCGKTIHFESLETRHAAQNNLSVRSLAFLDAGDPELHDYHNFASAFWLDKNMADRCLNIGIIKVNLWEFVADDLPVAKALVKTEPVSPKTTTYLTRPTSAQEERLTTIFVLEMMYIEKHLAKLSDSRKTILNDLETLAGSGVLVDSISINKVQEVREWVELRFTPRNSEEKGVGLLYDRIATMFVKNPQKPIYKNFNIGSIFFQEFESLNGEERLIQGIGPNLKVQFQVMFDRSAGLHSLPLQTIELQIREDIKRLSKDPLLDLSTTKMETLKTSGGDFSVRFLVYLAAADPLVRAFRRLASKYWNGELADSCKFLKIIKIGLWEHFEKDSSKISAVRSAPKEIPVPPLTIQPTPQSDRNDQQVGTTFTLEFIFSGRQLSAYPDPTRLIQEDLQTLAEDSPVPIENVIVKKVQQNASHKNAQHPVVEIEWVEVKFVPKTPEDRIVVGRLYSRVASGFLEVPRPSSYRDSRVWSVFFQEFNADGLAVQTIGPVIRTEISILYEPDSVLVEMPEKDQKERIREHLARLAEKNLPILNIETHHTKTGFAVNINAHFPAGDPALRDYRTVAAKYWAGELNSISNKLRILKINLWEHINDSASSPPNHRAQGPGQPAPHMSGVSVINHNSSEATALSPDILMNDATYPPASPPVKLKRANQGQALPNLGDLEVIQMDLLRLLVQKILLEHELKQLEDPMYQIQQDSYTVAMAKQFHDLDEQLKDNVRLREEAEKMLMDIQTEILSPQVIPLLKTGVIPMLESTGEDANMDVS